MEERLKQRLVGAAVLASVGVIGIPLLLGEPVQPRTTAKSAQIPTLPEGKFNSRIVPLEAPPDRARPTEQAVAAQPQDSADRSGGAVEERSPGPLPEATNTTSRVSRGPSDDRASPLAAWAIQLASFAKPNNAMRLRDKLRNQGYTAFMEEVHGTKIPVTRVFVGPRLRREQANETLEKLRMETGLNGLIVRYPAG